MKEIFKNLIGAVKANAGKVSVEGHGGVQIQRDIPAEEPSYTDEDAPRHNQIKREPLLAIEQGELVMAVDHTFQNVPSWVEWDPDRNILSVAEMNGTVNEARVALKAEHLGEMMARRKILMISNELGKGPQDKIMHYVPFLSRNA